MGINFSKLLIQKQKMSQQKELMLTWKCFIEVRIIEVMSKRTRIFIDFLFNCVTQQFRSKPIPANSRKRINQVTKVQSAFTLFESRFLQGNYDVVRDTHDETIMGEWTMT